MSKISLYGDTVLRKDGDQIYLMNRQEGGFRAWSIPIESEQWFTDHYHVRLGEWSRDEHGEFCPVTRVPRSEQPTLHDGDEGLTRARALGQALYEDGALSEQCFQPGKISDGLQQFIDTHPGVRVGMGPGPFLVDLMPDGSAVALDHDGTVIAEDELES